MLESTEDAAEAPPLMKKLSAAASSCQSAALSSSMASDSLAHRQASAQRSSGERATRIRRCSAAWWWWWCRLTRACTHLAPVKEMRFRTLSFWAFFSACMVGQGERASALRSGRLRWRAARENPSCSQHSEQSKMNPRESSQTNILNDRPKCEFPKALFCETDFALAN